MTDQQTGLRLPYLEVFRKPTCIPSAREHMKAVLEDLRYAIRVLRRTPTLTAVAVLTLALGIAATTTVFGWIDGMVLHPFHAARDDGQLAALEQIGRLQMFVMLLRQTVECQHFLDVGFRPVAKLRIPRFPHLFNQAARSRRASSTLRRS